MAQQDISLETLVSHLLASKRSLSSISTVWRANEIVTSARAALEESVVLSARTGFLRSGISEQVKILRKVRGGVENVYKEGQRDFKVCCHYIRQGDLKLIYAEECHSDLRCCECQTRVYDGYIEDYDGGGYI